MKLINDKGDDLSDEVIVQMMIVISMVYASELMCYRLANSYDYLRRSGTFFQSKKKALREAKECMLKCVHILEHNFDGFFDNIYNKVPGEELDRFNSIEWLAKDAIALMLDYHSRTDGDIEKNKKMHKALLNFKEGDVDFDVEEIKRYYNIENIYEK